MLTALFHRIRQFLAELRRRNVYRVAVTYVVVGFFVIEAADLTLTRLGLPPWTVTLVVVLVGLGFPIALVMAWALEVTPEGVRVEDTEGSEEELRAPSTTRDLWVGTSILVLLLLGAWWLWGGLGGGETSDQVPEIEDHSVAVLPFEVSGAGAEEWRDGMVTALSLNLDGAGDLRAVAARTIFAAWKKKEDANVGLGTQEALEVAREVGARYSVIGEAVQLGEDLRFGTEIYETSSGERLGQVDVRGAPESLTALTDRLTRKILGVLFEKSEERVPSVDLAHITTESLAALKAYLRGERHFRAGEYEAAIDDYQRAVQQDSTFALAYARLHISQGWGSGPSDDRALQRAYDLSDRLPPRERRLVRARYIRDVLGHPLAAADTLRRLTEEYPDDPSMWYILGEVVYHDIVPGGWPEAEKAFEEAVRLDAGVAPYHHHLVDLSMSLHHDSALAARRIEAHPPGPLKTWYRALADLNFGSDEDRQAAWARIDTLSIGEAWWSHWPLLHPTDRALQEQVIRRLAERGALAAGEANSDLIDIYLARGQINEGVSLWRKRPEASGIHLILPLSLGYPMPDSLLRPRLEPSRIESGASVGRLAAAIMYSIETGRFGDVDPLLDRLLDAFERESVPDRDVERIKGHLKGHLAWRRGNLERAVTLWSRLKDVPLEEYGAIWRGDLYRKLGELEKAEGWFLAGWQHPVAHERLGQLYEEMGKPEKAAAAYKRFIVAWKNADPALQDRVEATRNRLQALPTDADTNSPPASAQ